MHKLKLKLLMLNSESISELEMSGISRKSDLIDGICYNTYENHSGDKESH